MATLLLTAVGSAIGGPIGAAIGAMAGQRVDQALLGPKGRQGARLDVPVAEEAELYRIEIAALPLAGSIGATLAQPQYHLSAGQLADMRAAGATSLTLSVRQVGRFAQSDPATKAFPL